MLHDRIDHLRQYQSTLHEGSISFNLWVSDDSHFWINPWMNSSDSDECHSWSGYGNGCGNVYSQNERVSIFGLEYSVVCWIIDFSCGWFEDGIGEVWWDVLLTRIFGTVWRTAIDAVSIVSSRVLGPPREHVWRWMMDDRWSMMDEWRLDRVSKAIGSSAVNLDELYYWTRVERRLYFDWLRWDSVQ